MFNLAACSIPLKVAQVPHIAMLKEDNGRKGFFEHEEFLAVRDAWSRACQIARTPGMLFHDLRRTAIRNMIKAGIPERVAITISGHKTRAVFDRYNIVSPDDLKEAASKRQAFNEKMAERWLQNGYTQPKSSGAVVSLESLTN